MKALILTEGATLLLEKETLTHEQIPVLQEFPLAAATASKVSD